MITDKRSVWIDLVSYQVNDEGQGVSAPLNDINCNIVIKGTPVEIANKYATLLEDFKNAIIKATS